MAAAYFCVLIIAVLPLFLAGYAKFSSKGYDNSKPREFLEQLQGKGKRAHYTQLNTFEAFPFFAAAVIIAHLASVSLKEINLLAVLFVIFRLLYALFYILDKPSLRSAVWFGGFGCVVTLFISAILQG